MTVGGRCCATDAPWICGVVDRARRPEDGPELSTGTKNRLDSGAALTANRVEIRHFSCDCLRAIKFHLRAIACSALDPLVSPLAFYPLVCHRTSIIDHRGDWHWLTFSFSVRVPALRFQPASRPSGFCSRAFRASPCRYVARRAAKFTNGSPMTPGSVR